MAPDFILQPTTDAATSSTMRLPPLVWSPDPALCSTSRVNAAGETVSVLYDGSQLSHRNFRVFLAAGHGFDLPEGAHLEAYIKTFDAAGELPAQYERLPSFDLTLERKSLIVHGPIDGLEWRKPESVTPYGAMVIGAYGSTAQQTQ